MLSRFFFIILFYVFGSSAHALVLENLIKKGELDSTLSHKKVGYYIGSFDPLHLGHEAVANQVLDQNLCDYVLICPVWGGDIYKNRVDVKIRIEMLFSAFEHHLRVIVTRLTPGDLQKILMQDAVPLMDGEFAVKTKIPGVNYVGIVGSDAALRIQHNEKEKAAFMRGIKIPEKYKAHTFGTVMILPVQNFIVGLRKGDSIESLKNKLGDRPIIKTIQATHADDSSTRVRKAIKEGHGIEAFVSPGVKAIIEQYQLYQE